MLKYIIGKYPDCEIFFPIVFPEPVVHADIAKALPPGSEVLSAGFFIVLDHNEPLKIVVIHDKKSESLDIGPRPKEDSAFLELFLFNGLAGMDLHNYRFAAAMGLKR